MMMVYTHTSFSIIIDPFPFCCVVFVIEFTEEDYSFDEGESNAMVCLQGIGEIAQPATATVSSLNTGTASGKIPYL